jgi:hypothetical protein
MTAPKRPKISNACKRPKTSSISTAFMITNASEQYELITESEEGLVRRCDSYR